MTGISTQNFNKPVFLAGYVYYVPFVSGKVLRYQTQAGFAKISFFFFLSFHSFHFFVLSSSFSNASLWSSFDAQSINSNATYFFSGTVSHNRYLYLSPYLYGIFLRFDSFGKFNNLSSWSVFSSGIHFNATRYGSVMLKSNIN